MGESSSLALPGASQSQKPEVGCDLPLLQSGQFRSCLAQTAPCREVSQTFLFRSSAESKHTELAFQVLHQIQG